MTRLRLAIFDVDGTLKEERDPYVYLHRQLGTEAEGRAILAAFNRGEFDYRTVAERDAALWAGVPVERVDALFRAMPYIAEARALAEALVRAGVPLVLISTGLDLHVRQVAGDLGAARWIAQELAVADGRLTGGIRVNLGWDGKGRIARELKREFGVEPDACLAVGDGVGDLPVFAEVGHRIAVNPGSDSVRQAADFVLGEAGLGGWLRGLGM